MKIALIALLALVSSSFGQAPQATPRPLVLVATTTTPVQDLAADLLKRPEQLFRQNVAAWARSMKDVWSNPRFTPAEVLTALGPNAAALFQRSAEEAAFLELESPGCTAAVVALVKPYTVHSDGTVTLN